MLHGISIGVAKDGLHGLIGCDRGHAAHIAEAAGAFAAGYAFVGAKNGVNGAVGTGARGEGRAEDGDAGRSHGRRKVHGPRIVRKQAVHAREEGAGMRNVEFAAVVAHGDARESVKLLCGVAISGAAEDVQFGTVFGVEPARGLGEAFERPVLRLPAREGRDGDAEGIGFGQLKGRGFDRKLRRLGAGETEERQHVEAFLDGMAAWADELRRVVVEEARKLAVERWPDATRGAREASHKGALEESLKIERDVVGVFAQVAESAAVVGDVAVARNLDDVVDAPVHPNEPREGGVDGPVDLRARLVPNRGDGWQGVEHVAHGAELDDEEFHGVGRDSSLARTA